MVRHYKRTTDIGSFSEESMKEAVRLVQNGMSVREAAKIEGVKYPTLFRYARKAKMHAEQQQEVKFRPNYECRKIFSVEQEKILGDYILQCSKIFYGLSTEQCRKLAYEMVVTNQIPHPSNWDKQQIAGIDWFRGFMVRNPKLSIRTPEGCSLSRATSFNKSNVDLFFNNLQTVYKGCPEFATGTRIFNLDETCTSTVQKPPKIVAEKGVKQVSKCTSAEKGTSVTTCCIISATGNTVPPAMIFPRVHFKPHMIQQAPPSTLGLANSSGWMTSELFIQVMKHFIKHTNSSKEAPTLLLCDNHESHLSIEVLELARSNGVTILTFPPHSTNRMQPLDVAVFKPFKTFYNAAVDNWLMEHPGQTFSIYNVASCVNVAHQKAMTPTNIIAAFRKTGIFPLDKDVFSEADFLCSFVTDRPYKGPLEQESLSTDKDQTQEPLLRNEPSSANEDTEKVFNFSPEDVRGLPKAGERTNVKKCRRKGKSIVATSTPEMKARAENSQKKTKCSQGNVKRTLFRKAKKEDSGSSDDNTNSIVLADSDNDEELVEELLSSFKEDEFEELERDAKVGDYVLVEFEASGRKKFYVAIVTKDKDCEGDCEVSFFRTSLKKDNAFLKPNIEDIATVNCIQIKMILPQPSHCGQTKRLKGYLSFGIDFSSLNMG